MKKDSIGWCSFMLVLCIINMLLAIFVAHEADQLRCLAVCGWLVATGGIMRRTALAMAEMENNGQEK